MSCTTSDSEEAAYEREEILADATKLIFEPALSVKGYRLGRPPGAKDKKVYGLIQIASDEALLTLWWARQKRTFATRQLTRQPASDPDFEFWGDTCDDMDAFESALAGASNQVVVKGRCV